MATFTVSGLDAYKKFSRDILAEAILPKTLSPNISIMPTVKGTAALTKMDNDLFLQLGDCVSTTSGTTTFTQKDITTCKFNFLKDYCVNELEGKWFAEYLKAGSTYTNLDFLEGTILTNLAGQLAEQNEKIAWQGKASASFTNPNLNLCDGWLESLADDSNRVQTGYTSTTATTYGTQIYVPTVPTSTNIIGLINAMIEKLPSAIQGKNLELYLSFANYNKFVIGWITSYGYQPFLTNQDYIYPLFPNIKLVPQSGLDGTNYMILTMPENLYLATDMLDENDTVTSFYYEKEDKVYVRAKYKLGFAVAYPEYAVCNF